MTSTKKGKTLEEMYGEEKANEIRKKLSESHKGKQTWNKGKNMPSISGKNHYLYGKHLPLETRTKIRNKKKKNGYIRDGYKIVKIFGKAHRVHHINWMVENGISFIPEGWIVHHRNLDKLDNQPENLLLVPQDSHAQWHWKYEKENNITRFGGDKNF